MGTMKFEVAHALPKADARARIEALTRYWTKHGIKSSWAGDGAALSGKIMGLQFDAALRVTEKSVGGEGTDPGMLLRGQAKKYLEKKFSAYLDPARSLAELEALKD